ncbi:hypothetical protein GCM10007981_10990 [Thermocladium modestius]|uniref:Uncharacterized protein n=1 Tax=Thermocladium modestius TaxID=62609 RepID=A0A830GW90_9CREN|nr:hypothetical protein [Thermocladium modestius]GGP20930.1 hypothetical protein GCM10007981_10990 [Thermocladium modestius]
MSHIENAKEAAELISIALQVKPSDCIDKNHQSITMSAINDVGRIFPELSGKLQALASKFAEIQAASRRLTEAPSVEAYADAVLTIFTQYNVDPGIYAVFAALQGMHAAQACGADAAKFFLARTMLAGSLPFNLYLMLADYINIDHKMIVEMFKNLLGKGH